MQPFGLIQLAAPAEEPLTLAEARLHLRVDGADDDGTISALIAAAREHVEAFTSRSLLTQRWTLVLDRFEGCIELPRPPLQSVEAIRYLDSDGAQQILDPTLYRVATGSEPGRLTPAYAQSWPATLPVNDAVEIDFTAGWAGTDRVPRAIKQAMLLLIGHWFENREAINVGNIVNELPLAVEALLWPHRILRF